MKRFVFNCYNFYRTKILIFSKIQFYAEHMRDFENMRNMPRLHET